MDLPVGGGPVYLGGPEDALRDVPLGQYVGDIICGFLSVASLKIGSTDLHGPTALCGVAEIPV